jgi:hypothetical protein
MVALFVFAVVIAGVVAGMSTALTLTRTNRDRATAAYVAADQLEQVRASFNADPTDDRFAGYPSGPATTSTRTVGNITFTITQSITWVSPRTNSSACTAVNATATGTVLAYLRVRVVVSWPAMAGVKPVTSETLLTPPYDATVGNLSVLVSDRDGNALVGDTVTLGGTASRTGTVTDDGCAFFSGLAPGNYTVTYTKAGWVDWDGNSPTTRTLGVTAGTVTSTEIDVDQAATITVGPAATTGTLPDGMGITVANTSLTTGTEVSAWTSSATAVTGLFPFANGYGLWAGSCADADPTYTGNGGTRATVTVSPGATTAATTALTVQPVQVYRNTTGTTARSAAILRAVHVGSASCPSSAETLVFTAGPSDASGVARLALPYGSWRLESTNRTNYTTPTVTIRPGVTPSTTIVRVS